MDEFPPCVYILTNRPQGVLYIGVTSNLVKRVWEHKNKLIDGFSKQAIDLVRTAPGDVRCNYARAAIEKVEARLEN